MNYFWIAQFKKDFFWDFSYKLTFLWRIASIAISVFIFFFISKTFSVSNNIHLGPFNNNYFLFVIVGIGIMDLITVIIGATVKIVRDAQMLGFLDMFLNSRISASYTLFCGMLYPTFIGILKFICYLIMAFYLQEYEFSMVVIEKVAIVGILTILPFFGVGLFSASFVLAFKQSVPINSLVSLLLLLLSGIIYPITVLPDYLQYLSNLIPATHGIDLMRQILTNNSESTLTHESLFYLLFTSVASLVIGFSSLRLSIMYVKKLGTSGGY